MTTGARKGYHRFSGLPLTDKRLGFDLYIYIHIYTYIYTHHILPWSRQGSRISGNISIIDFEFGSHKFVPGLLEAVHSLRVFGPAADEDSVGASVRFSSTCCSICIEADLGEVLPCEQACTGPSAKPITPLVGPMPWWATLRPPSTDEAEPAPALISG